MTELQEKCNTVREPLLSTGCATTESAGTNYHMPKPMPREALSPSNSYAIYR